MPGPDPNGSPTRSHSLSITLLRGFAALAVVLYHASHPFRTEGTPPGGLALAVLGHGWFGVDLFFLISGYGLAAKLSGGEKLRGPPGAAAFVWNRCWRIFPLYWASCVVVVALAWTAGRFNGLDWRQEFPPDFAGVAASLLLVEPFTGTPAILPVVSWTLTCEVAFYAMVAAAILLRARVADASLVIAATVLALIGAVSRMPGPAHVFAFWPEFVCGVLVFVAGAARTGGRRADFRSILAVLVILAATAAACGHSRLVATVAIGLALVAVQSFEARFGHGRPLRWLAWLGTISFPLFLLHVPVISRATNLGRRLAPPGNTGLLLVVTAAIALAVAMAWLMHTLLEKPLLRLARRPATRTN